MAGAVHDNEYIQEEFALYGHEDLSDELCNRIRDALQKSGITLDSLVPKWEDYREKNLNEQLTVENFDTFVRQNLDVLKKLASKTSDTKSPVTPTSSRAAFSIRGVNNGADLCAQYGGLPITPSPQSKRGATTPDELSNKRRTYTGVTTPKPASSPICSYTPTPSKKYKSRQNRGNVETSYGDCKEVVWATNRTAVAITVGGKNISEEWKDSSAPQYRYMFQKLMEKISVLDQRIEELSQCISALQSTEYNSVIDKCQEEVYVTGHISCDCEGHLNTESILLQGSVQTSHGKTIPVSVKNADSYSIFPGQVVVMKARNPNGEKLLASEVYTPDLLPRPHIDHCSELKIVIACGSFTPDDGDSYDPLADLIEAVRTSPPDVLILFGPWVDQKNKIIANGSKSFESYFDDWLTILMERIMSVTQVILVSSQRDLHHQPIYPTPLYKVTKDVINSEFSKKLHCVMDPTLLEIDGITFGMTSTDVLFQLAADEISWNPKNTDRLGRICEHLLSQRSFFPCYPPNTEFNLDLELSDKHSKMNASPHILITPSDFKPFIKDVAGTLCINPGRLCKGFTGGTFVRIAIPKLDNVDSVTDKASVQVVKI